jgi:DNA-binding transcriptional regulator YdaS (Cro superfamily)
MKIVEMDIGLRRAVTGAGSPTELARRLGITQAAIHQWEKIPAERVVAVEQASGVPRHLLRPDLHLPPSYEPQKGLER